MANNYVRTVTTGQETSWTQPKKVEVDFTVTPDSPTTCTASVNVSEETVFVGTDGTVFTEPSTSLSYVVTDPSTTFNLLDSSGNVVGTATDAQLLQMFNSKYIALAQARDAAPTVGE